MVNFNSSQTMFLIFFISIILGLIGYFSAGPLMSLIGAGPEIIDDSIAYFKISSLGFVFLFIFFSFQSLMRGIGNVMLPVYIVLFTVFLNLVLDPLFIYGYGPIPAYGVAGAAVASILTQGISAIIALFVLFRGKNGIEISFSNMYLDMKSLKRLVNLGLPSSMEQSTRALAMIMMVVLVTSFGSEIVAAYGIGSRILSFIIVPALGFSIATTTLVSQNIGALKIKRAQKVGELSSKVAFFGLTGMGILMFVFAEEIVGFFIPNEPTVIRDAALFIKIMAPSFGLMGVQQVLNGVFNGAGFTKASMLISIMSLWIVRFPVAYLLSYNTSLGYEGIWWAFPIANLIAAIVAFTYFKMGYWKTRLIKERH